MKATEIIIEFWKYESTGVRLGTDIWIHGVRDGRFQNLARLAPSTEDRESSIAAAHNVAELLGLELVVKDMVIAKEGK